MPSLVTVPLYGNDLPGPMNCVLGIEDSEDSAVISTSTTAEGMPPPRCRQLRLKQRVLMSLDLSEDDSRSKIEEERTFIHGASMSSASESALRCLSKKEMRDRSKLTTSVILNVIEGWNLVDTCLIDENDFHRSGMFLEAQQWVQDWLQVAHGDLVECETVPDALPKLSADGTISVSFMGYWSFLSWSEMATKGEVFAGSSWKSSWPENVSESTIGRILNLTLPGTQSMVCGGLFAIDYLELQLVFRVDKIAFQDANIEFAARGLATVVIVSETQESPSDSNEARQDAPSNIACALLCQKEARETAELILDAASRSSIDRSTWCGPRSMLVCGSKGSGKSVVLRQVSLYASSKGICSIIAMSASQRNSFGSLSHLHRLTSNSSTLTPINDDPIGASLVKLLSLSPHVDYYCTSKVACDRLAQYSNGQLPSLQGYAYCLILDDLEYFAGSDDDQDSESTAGACLRDLLYHLSGSKLSACELDLIVIGSSNTLSKASVQRFMRPPGFELLRYVLSPLEGDRKSLILHAFEESGVYVVNSPCTPDSSKACRIRDFRSPSGILIQNKSDENRSTIEAANRLARMTHGYLPCDIYSLVRKAVVYSKADRYMRGNHCHGIQVEIGWSDCLVALGAVGPSQLSHLSATGFAEVVPRQHMNLGASLTWNDFGGSADAKNKIRMLVSRLTENIAFETAEENGASYSKNILSDSLRDKPKGMVLTGPSGHGKSYLARIIAAETNFNFINVNSTGLLSKYYGETEENVRKLFATARSVAPAVLFFDEFEGLSAKRSMSDGGSTDSGVAGRVLSTFLNELDGISPPGGNSSVSGDVLVIVACLNADNLDPALVRPGRLQHHFNLGAFYFEDACDIVANLIRKLPEGTKVVTNPEDIVRIFEEKSKSILSPSKVVAFFQQAVLEAVKDVIAENANFDMLESSSSLCPEIDAIHFARALL